LKSRIVSVYAPAWLWLHAPHARINARSVNPDVAVRDADLARQLVQSTWYRKMFSPSWQIRDDADAKTAFHTTAGGLRYAKGMTAKVTGVRSDVVIVDDPNDVKDVWSDAARLNVHRAWTALSNRVNDPRTSIRILIQQRCHEEDLTGIVVHNPAWEHLVIQQERDAVPPCMCHSCARGESFIGWRDERTPGELMHPGRFTPASLAEARADLGSYGYAGQHQQRPAPLEGGMFKRSWFKFVDPAELPEFEEVLLSVDPNVKATDHGSRCCVMVLARAGNYRYVLDVWNKSVNFTEQYQAVAEVAARWPQARRVLMEAAANGNAITDHMTRTIKGINVIPVEAGQQKKEQRAAVSQPIVESGVVCLPKGAPWVEEFLLEVCTFPNGAHDDQVDALSQALNYMRGSSAATHCLKRFGLA
jgi:predicted phage terminase large subunit-like protein